MATATLNALQATFYPSPDKVTLTRAGTLAHEQLSLMSKVYYYTTNFFKGVFFTAVLPLSVAYSTFRYLGGAVFSLGGRVVSWFNKPKPSPISSTVTNPAVLPDATISAALPNDVGYADSMFQSSGLGTSHSQPPLLGRSNWDAWLTPEHIEMNPGDTFDQFFRNIIGDPSSVQRFIQRLKDSGCTAHRFSLERSVIETAPGVYDSNAINLYKHFCQQLKANGIEPWVTLQHFVEPKWFHDMGGFEREENIANFVDYCDTIVPQFDMVTNWMTFNEPAPQAFQAQIRGVYPAKRTGIEIAGKVMRNLMIAHKLVYDRLTQRNPLLNVGITHQWLKFKPYNENNPIERMVCHYLSLITHYAVYNFLKTGVFTYQLPGCANLHLRVTGPITKFIGAQFYGFVRLKIGFNGGQEHPGYGVKNVLTVPWLWSGLTFGNTCHEGGSMNAFGPPYNPEGLAEALDEAFEISPNVAITETGSDVRVQHWGQPDFGIDEAHQEKYYKRIYSLIARRYPRRLIALFNWTLNKGHLEWDRGRNVTLGVDGSQAHRYITRIFSAVQRPMLLPLQDQEPPPLVEPVNVA